MKKTIAGAALGLTLLCAACSSGTSGSSAKAGETSAHTAPAAAPAGTAKATSAAPAGKDANTWCAEVEAAGTSLDPSDDQSLPPDYAGKSRVIVADAPSAIKSDIATLVKAVEAAGGTVDDDNAPQVLPAAEHVASWLQTNCPALFQKMNPDMGSAQPTS